ncbi:MAG TPA: aminodeoxychorismate synthase component I [Spirochaetota bacterium]|nr:aminodeoxychorismate synthase component I [Spirochaetota bacterium]HOM37785.1 aminodeoxychorismate synthase component I [Spirochaetota bacterium]HPQ49338.1 aminodeoxychorismate synthase component I [Spirochaetota bacterium]
MEIVENINKLSREKIPFIFIIDFEMEKPLLFSMNELPENIFFKIGNIQKIPDTNIKTIPEKIKLFIKPIEYDKYLKKINIVQEEERNGNSYLTNLTFKTKIETNIPLETIFILAEAKYKILLQDNFLVFSPETFIRIKDGYIYSYPMKGTIDASIENAEKILLEDQKEIAEHITIVDLIRNDLNSVSENVEVIKYRYIETIKTNNKKILQTSSEIRGKLPENYYSNLGEIIFKLLPAGSVSGAPKKKTVEIIKKAENEKRGYYTGVFGYFDGKNLDSCVMIRYIEKVHDKIYYRSGGGITVYSDPKKEYQELLDKIYVPIHRNNTI